MSNVFGKLSSGRPLGDCVFQRLQGSSSPPDMFRLWRFYSSVVVRSNQSFWKRGTREFRSRVPALIVSVSVMDSGAALASDTAWASGLTAAIATQLPSVSP